METRLRLSGHPEETGLEGVPDTEAVVEVKPASNKKVGVVGDLDVVEDTLHPSQLAGAEVLAVVEVEGYPLTTHVTCSVMDRVPLEMWVAQYPLHKRHLHPSPDLQRPNEGQGVQPDRQRLPEPSTAAWTEKTLSKR